MDRHHTTWASSERFVPKTFIRPVVRFTRIEASSGIVLLLAAIAALVWANSAYASTYFSILQEPVTVELFAFRLEETVQHLVNDGLMVIFFFVVGLEIKRELVLGDLKDPKAAALPVMAALGGMVFPALIFIAFTVGDGGEALRGWGIPMATDIAFALGVVALLGSRIPSGAKLFLLAVAIADDIGAIAVIALFYTDDLEAGFLGAAVAALLLVWVASKVNVRSMAFYLPMGLVIWYLTLESGVHATLAGVALGFLTPARPYYEPQELDSRSREILDTFPATPNNQAQERADHEALLLSEIANESVAPLSRLEHALTPWSSYVIVPIFALANAGVDFRSVSFSEALTSSVALGVAVGLIVGKIVGISGFAYAAVRLRLGVLPPRTGWPQVVGLAAVAGIGFTVSLFVTGLAFSDPHLRDLAKVGIFTGSVVAGLLGTFLLYRARPPSEL